GTAGDAAGDPAEEQAAAVEPGEGEAGVAEPDAPESPAPDNAAASDPPAQAAAPESAESGSGGLDATQLAAAAIAGGIPTWQRLARPFPPDETRPRIAIIVAGLGLSEAATTAAIQQLPAEISLSFSPYSNRIEEWVAMARAAGHEVLIDLPMEPTSFPRDDPGPRALLTSLSPEA